MIISVSGKIGSGKDTVGKIIQYLLYMSIEQKGRYYPYDVFIQEIETVNFHGSVDWEIKKFADKLKDIVCLLLGCTREQLEDRDFKEKELGEEWWYRKLERRGGYGTTLLPYSTPSEVLENYRNLKTVKLTPRLLLQLLGTECGRDILHPNIWINALMSGYRTEGINRAAKIKILESQGTFPKNNDWTAIEEEEMYLRANPKFPTESKWIITDTRFPNELDAVKSKGGITIRVVRPPYKWIDADAFHFEKTGKKLPKIIEHESETALDTAKFDHEIINDGSMEELIEKVKQILILEKII